MARTLFTREQWLDHGIELFGRAGRGGLKVERMARDLGCSKSSFYWYFSSRQDFEARLIERWRDKETRGIIADAEARRSPREKLRTLFDEVLLVRSSGDFLFHLRALAARSRRVRDLLKRVEGERLGYLARVLVELGQGERLARERAEVIYNYYLGWYERNKTAAPTPREVRRQLAIVSHILGVELDGRSEVRP